MRRLEGWGSLRALEASRQVEWSGRKCCWPTGRIHRSLRWARDLPPIIKLSNAASNGRWPTARWRHSMTGPDRARSRPSRQRRRPGWCLWRATRPRSTAIHTSCGRRGCWPVMRVSTDRRWGTNVSPTWSKARCARSSAKRKSSRTRCATTWNVAMLISSRRWRRFCASIARFKS